MDGLDALADVMWEVAVSDLAPQQQMYQAADLLARAVRELLKTADPATRSATYTLLEAYTKIAAPRIGPPPGAPPGAPLDQ